VIPRGPDRRRSDRLIGLTRTTAPTMTVDKGMACSRPWQTSAELNGTLIQRDEASADMKMAGCSDGTACRIEFFPISS
jgi:hypothetical protein